jgi:hypothetical protein
MGKTWEKNGKKMGKTEETFIKGDFYKNEIWTKN